MIYQAYDESRDGKPDPRFTSIAPVAVLKKDYGRFGRFVVKNPKIMGGSDSLIVTPDGCEFVLFGVYLFNPDHLYPPVSPE